MKNSRTKAYLVTGFFILVLIASLLWNNSKLQDGLPLIIFYLVITLNTFFSVNLFSSLVPIDNLAQNLIDGILIICYVALAFTISNPLLFAVCVTALFAIATLKYLLLLPILNQPRLLKRKILIDISGIILGLAAVAGILAGYSFYTCWIMTTLFTLANICLLFIWPMYREDGKLVS